MSHVEPLYRIRCQDDVHIVEFLRDAIDPAGVESLGKDLPRTIQQTGIRKLVIDMAKVAYAPSRVLSALLEVHRTMTAQEGQLRLCGIQPLTLSIFQFTRLDTLLQITNTCEEAVRSFAPQAH